MKYLITNFVVISSLFLCSCGNYAKKSDFDNYKSQHAFEHANVNAGILFNEDKLKVYKDKTDLKFKSIDHKIESVEHKIKSLDISTNTFNQELLDYKAISKIAAEATNLKFEQEITDLLLPSFIMYISSHNYEVHIGSEVKIIEIQ